MIEIFTFKFFLFNAWKTANPVFKDISRSFEFPPQITAISSDLKFKTIDELKQEIGNSDKATEDRMNELDKILED